jgi:hypothetical protein
MTAVRVTPGNTSAVLGENPSMTTERDPSPIHGVLPPTPASPPRRRRWPWAVAALIVAAALGAGAVLLFNREPAPAGAAPNPPSTTSTTSVTTDTTSPPASLPPQQAVDQAVAADGVPFNYDTRFYSDAYSAIVGECQAWDSTGSNVDGLLRGRVQAGYIQPGEIAALRVGVPLACPQYASAVKGALGD